MDYASTADLRQALAAEGVPIEEGTLYPLLRRLESLGLLVSEWRLEDGPRRSIRTATFVTARAPRARGRHLLVFFRRASDAMRSTKRGRVQPLF
jgi:hypothetical protein